MGYDTKFYGKFRLSRRLTDEEFVIIDLLRTTRHGGNFAVHDMWPGFYCQWKVNSKDRSTIAWDRCEKFYDCIMWLNLIIDCFLEPWGVTITGRVRWKGEAVSDKGIIECDESVCTVRFGPVQREKKSSKKKKVNEAVKQTSAVEYNTLTTATKQ